jgi:hypothetical protein
VNSNPYRPPQAHVRDLPESDMDGTRVARLGSGQKLAIYAICLYLGLMLLRGFLVGFFRPNVAVGVLILLGLLAIAGGLAAVVLSLVGLWRMADGLGIHVGFRVIMMLLLFIPILNIIILLVLNSRATRALRQAGYEVGFFGAKGWSSQ